MAPIAIIFITTITLLQYLAKVESLTRISGTDHSSFTADTQASVMAFIEKKTIQKHSSSKNMNPLRPFTGIRIPAVMMASSADSTSITKSYRPAIFSIASKESAQLAVAGSITGLLTASVILLVKRSLAAMDKFVDNYRVLSLIVGGLIISSLSAFDENITKMTFPEISTESFSKALTYPMRRYLVRLAGLVVTLGSGFSLGAAGPAAEIGMVCSIFLSRFINDLGDSQKLGLLLAGAGAGIAANFNAPLTALFYVSEVCKSSISRIKDASETEKDSSKDMLNKVSLSFSILASCLVVRGSSFSKSNQVLTLSTLNMDKVTVLRGAAIVSVGLVATCVHRLFLFVRSQVANALQHVSPRIRPILAGLTVGLASLSGYSQSLLKGFATVNTISTGAMGGTMPLLKYSLLRLLLIAHCSTSGLIGGLFAPMIFLGAGVGGLYHQLLSYAFPTLIDPSLLPAFVLAGSASLLARNFKAFFMPVLLIAELTKSLELTLILFLACGCSLLATD